ncbi:MAG: polysaccharide biosynthesis/export family protein [Flavobacteriales bacterium]|nr:polysaccharide biosynthesis/export family protein [Flavobacteriales bacterium]
MKKFLPVLAVIALLSSCTINKNLMFKTDTEFTYDTPSTDTNEYNYRISPNDLLLFRLFTNDGARLLEVTTSTDQTNSRLFNFGDITYQVQSDGTVKLPELGNVKVQGLTVFEAQDMLEEKYAQYYNEPYAVVQVTNNRVIVFPGSGGDALVVPLVNQNTTVIEALARAGGIANRGDASKVKLFRKVDGKQEVYLMDLSTIEGIQYANMVVQANDIIYVQPVPEIATEVLKDVSPFVSIVSGLALIYAILVTNL